VRLVADRVDLHGFAKRTYQPATVRRRIFERKRFGAVEKIAFGAQNALT
jgi:hypothetical protein